MTFKVLMLVIALRNWEVSKHETEEVSKHETEEVSKHDIGMMITVPRRRRRRYCRELYCFRSGRG